MNDALTLPACQACNGSGAILGEFGLRICSCAGCPSAEALAAAIRDTAEQQRRATLLVPVTGKGPLMIACPTCEGAGRVLYGGDGRREYMGRCPDECCGGRVQARCLCCSGECFEGTTLAVEDSRLPETMRRECADFICDERECRVELAVLIGGYARLIELGDHVGAANEGAEGAEGETNG